MSIYCTYLTVYKGNKLPPFYIGSTSINKIKMGYKGSVKSDKYMELWKHELKHYPMLFSTRIISIHDTREAAYIKESKLQKQLSVVSSPLYINMTDVTTNKIGNYVRTKKIREKMSASRKLFNATHQAPKKTKEQKDLSYTNAKEYWEPSLGDRTQQFIYKAGIIHQGRYDYSSVCYTNSDSLVDIICPTHGIFKQRPSAHLRGSACPHCWTERKQELHKKDKDVFISQATAVHGTKFVYDEVVYQNTKTPVIIICPIHGPFTQRPEKHLMGCGCKKCSHRNRKSNIKQVYHL